MATSTVNAVGDTGVAALEGAAEGRYAQGAVEGRRLMEEASQKVERARRTMEEARRLMAEGRRQLAEGRRLVGPPAKQPNMLLLFPDQLRWDWASFHPSRAELRMPNLQALASQGTRFESAYTPAPLCVPARACLASFQEYDHSPVKTNAFNYPIDKLPKYKTWYRALQEVGYHTIVVGKDDLTQRRGPGLKGSLHARELGFSDWFRTQDKFATYMARPYEQFGEQMKKKPCKLHESNASDLFDCNRWCYGTMGRGKCCRPVGTGEHGWQICSVTDKAPQEDYYDDFLAAQAEAALDRAPKGKPWVLHVSFPGPHPPFVLTELMNRSISSRPFPSSATNTVLSAAEQTLIRQQYAGQIENLDLLFGRLLAKVDAMGEMADTLVVLMSDHGEQLGDHDAFEKQKPWEGSVHVPLVMRGPGIPAGRVVHTPVSTLDVVGTFIEASGADWHESWPSTSLGPLLAPEINESAYRPFVSSGLTGTGIGTSQPVDWRVVIKQVNATHTLKLVCCPQGCPSRQKPTPLSPSSAQLMLFNVAADPDEVSDLAHAAPDEVDALARLLPGSYSQACSKEEAPLHANASAIPDANAMSLATIGAEGMALG